MATKSNALPTLEKRKYRGNNFPRGQERRTTEGTASPIARAEEADASDAAMAAPPLEESHELAPMLPQRTEAGASTGITQEFRQLFSALGQQSSPMAEAEIAEASDGEAEAGIFSATAAPLAQGRPRISSGLEQSLFGSSAPLASSTASAAASAASFYPPIPGEVSHEEKMDAPPPFSASALQRPSTAVDNDGAAAEDHSGVGALLAASALLGEESSSFPAASPASLFHHGTHGTAASSSGSMAGQPPATGGAAAAEAPPPLLSLLQQHGARQQGLVSAAHGKAYEAPITMKGRRAEQIQRQITNLVLNAVQPRPDEAHTSPVEVQSSLVGNKLMLNTNNRSSEEALVALLVQEGSLHNLVHSDRAKNPAMDHDTERPVRYQKKLERAQATARSWQQGPATPENRENDADLANTQLVLNALQGNIFSLDPDAEDFAAQLEHYKADHENPGVLVVKHSSQDRDLDTEHAERVQSRFRARYLADQENPVRIGPVGPKTPCLGCQAHHEAGHPDLADRNGLSGAYFQGGSPAETPAENQVAHRLARQRPATGSVSQNGYFRNSDYPDSDSDGEGSALDPRPTPVRLMPGEASGKNMTWIYRGVPISVPRTYKRSKLTEAYLERKRREALAALAPSAQGDPS